MKYAAIMAVSLSVSSCASLQGLKVYAAEKAERLAHCQLEELTEDKARKCLGQFARDLGTKACKDANLWLEELHGPRPNE